MNLGFYYHIPLRSEGRKLFLPGYLAVFVDSLASEVEMLYLFLHEEGKNYYEFADTELRAENIKWINLGEKTPSWHRVLAYRKILSPILQWEVNLDLILVRSPSPLAPYFKKVLVNKEKIIYLVVGDYLNAALQLSIKSIRDIFIWMFLLWNDFMLFKALKNSRMMANSHALAKRYENVVRQVVEIRTTTLRKSDFYKRIDTCCSPVIKLAYVGRLDLQKGLLELLQAVAKLIHIYNYPIELHFTGWEAPSSCSVEDRLRRMVRDLNVKNKVFFHGRKRVGEELNAMYRQADIYVIPSYNEGFPRTIWEAMANSCLVIATRVGSIPYYLEHEKHALLIEAKNVDEIVDAVRKLIENPELRQELIRNGYQLAFENTLEVQTKKLFLYLKSFLYSS